MGFISEFVKSSRSPPLTKEVSQSIETTLRKREYTFPGQGTGRALWREVFGNVTTDKEEAYSSPRVVPGGSYGRSALSSDAATKRLLQAMRSNAPGGWSDDRMIETKRFDGIAYVAIHSVCRQMSQAKFQVFVKQDNHPDGKVAVTKHTPPSRGKNVRPYDLVELLEKPNTQDSFGKMMYRWGQQMRLTGSALTWMVPNMLGVPMELYPIPTAIAIPQPTINPDYPDGFWRIQPVYPYGPFSTFPTPSSAVGAPIPAQWMMRFLYPHPLLRYDGFSPMTGMRLHLDEVEMMDRARHYAMRRTINPSAVLNFDELENAQPLPEPEIERIKAEFENEWEGPENAGKIYIATPGAKLERWDSNLRDMEYQAGWDQLVSFCMGGFGITKPAAGMVEGGSYATLFATLKQLHMLTIQPDCDDIASDITRTLAPHFGDNLVVEIKCNRIDDQDLRNAGIQVAMAARAITKNEVRHLLKELGLNVTHMPWGNDVAGVDPQPPESQAQPPLDQQQANQSQMAMQAVLGQQNPEQTQGGFKPDESKIEPSEVANQRPLVGNIAQGAAGPRKSLNNVNGYYFTEKE